MVRLATSAAKLPLYTLDLARRYWAPLLCVYTVGTFLHGMLLRGMVWASRFDAALALLGLGLAVLVTLATTIIMFHLLRPGMPTVDAELVGMRLARRATFGGREWHVVDAVTMAILPFLLFYSGWGLLADEYRRYSVALLNDRGLDAWLTQDYDPLGTPLVIAVVALALRTVCEHLYKRGGTKVLGVLTALFEGIWMFAAVFSVAQLFDDAKEWLTTRVVWVEVQNVVLAALDGLGDMTSLPIQATVLALLAAIGTVWGYLKDGLFEPLLWLTIAAVIFRAEIDRPESLFDEEREETAVGRAIAGTPRLMRRVGRVAGRDAREKYTPFLNAFRFVLRLNPVFYLSFCLYYVLLEAAFGWLRRGIYVLIGPADFLGWWWQWLTPIDFVVTGLHELLRVCLLAATFEVMLRRVGAESAGRRSLRSTRLG
ncbi:hypothetical protein GCM10009799_47650 [Nocardiopsis rhodophaea]|uniref:Uncharacterized protein n=1 Tax=Nocardiopsis rhodophaea TaxID=280238 RepID=A0ABP5F3S1_9ACTN